MLKCRQIKILEDEVDENDAEDEVEDDYSVEADIERRNC